MQNNNNNDDYSQVTNIIRQVIAEQIAVSRGLRDPQGLSAYAGFTENEFSTMKSTVDALRKLNRWSDLKQLHTAVSPREAYAFAMREENENITGVNRKTVTVRSDLLQRQTCHLPNRVHVTVATQLKDLHSRVPQNHVTIDATSNKQPALNIADQASYYGFHEKDPLDNLGRLIHQGIVEATDPAHVGTARMRQQVFGFPGGFFSAGQLTFLDPVQPPDMWIIALTVCERVTELFGWRLVENKFLAGLRCLREIRRYCAYMLVCRTGIVVVPQPNEIHLASGRLHNLSGPAISWEGQKEYAVDGVEVRDITWVTDREKLTAKKIRASNNIEQRRIGIVLMGSDKYLKDIGATVVDIDIDGRADARALLQEPDGTKWLVARDGSTEGRTYFMRAPNNVMTCAEAYTAITGQPDVKCIGAG